VAAAEAGVPVVPVAIRGTRSMLRSDSWFPRRGAIAVTIGPPIAPPDREGDTAAEPWALALNLRRAAREFILARCGEPDLGGELQAA
jgi:1-acyl-sn-glycerol-3-phosphate acyltransferase